MFASSNIPKWLQELDNLEDTAYEDFVRGDKKIALQKYLLLEEKYLKLKSTQRYNFNYQDKLSNVLAQIGRCYSELNDFKKALITFGKILKVSPYRLDVCYELAVAAYSNADFQTAKTYAQKIITSDGKAFTKSELIINKSFPQIQKETYLLLANIAEAEENKDKLKEYAEKGEKFSKLAEIALNEKKYDQAKQYAQKVIADKTSDTESICLAYYYWAISLIFPFKLTLEIDLELNSEEEKKQVQQKRVLAISLLNKSLSLLTNITSLSAEKKAPIFIQAAILYEANTPMQDHAKAITFYEQAMEGGMPEAMHNLGLKYEEGEGIEKNEKLAFDLYLRAAKLGFSKAQIDLAKCYLQGIGCNADIPQAEFWAEKVAKEAPLAKHYLAGALLQKAMLDNDTALGQRAIHLLTEAAEAEIKHAYVCLGNLYHEGIFTEQNFSLAESCYRHALRLGVGDIAAEGLLKLGREIMSATALGEANYEMAKSTCCEIFTEYYGQHISEENKQELQGLLSKFIGEDKKKEFSSFIKLNKNIVSVYDYQYLTAEEKINHLLNIIQPEKVNTFNLSTIFLKLGDLFDHCQLSTFLFKQHQDKIKALMAACLKKFLMGAFSIRSLCNLATGLCKLYRHGYLLPAENLLNHVFRKLSEEKSVLALIDVASIFSAACRTNLQNAAIAIHLQRLVDHWLSNCEKYINARENLSSIFYSLAMLDNYAKGHPEFNLNIHKNLIQPLLFYAIMGAENKFIKKEDRHAYLLAALYFSCRYPEFTEPSWMNRLKPLQEGAEFKNNSTHKSGLQKEVHSYVSANLVGCLEEVPINTLPVDILYKNHVIKVNGPSHYVVIDEGGNHVKAPKDELNSTLLNCHFDKNGQPLTYPQYMITEIDYRQYEKEGKAYVKEALEKNGLKLPNLTQNTSSFHGPISNQGSPSAPTFSLLPTRPTI